MYLELLMARSREIARAQGLGQIASYLAAARRWPKLDALARQELRQTREAEEQAEEEICDADVA
jgi:hypothetical protein